MARACLSAIFRGPRLGLAGRRWGSYALSADRAVTNAWEQYSVCLPGEKATRGLSVDFVLQQTRFITCIGFVVIDTSS